MEGKFKNLEILSPAGNSECFFADINAGADAIYLGLSSFNARMKADNFTTENIREFIEYAHLFGVKIYVTINTLIEDEDFPKLIEMVKILVDAKVDAFIVQDFGVAYLLKNSFKNIVLHASTQMGIHNLDGAKVAEKLGFTRIVLSREAKLEDIRLIHNNTNLEIEYFIQGALCVAFSGNCYLSSVEKNMSGNEGKCLQLCRLPYSNNITNETAYNLSARDLGLLENLPSLIEAGVTSFKIEGRMRHKGYCAITTKIYKTALQKISNREFTKDWIEEQYNILRQTFSRGEFNKSAYLDNDTPDSIIYKDYQNHIGVEIGNVLSVLPFKSELYKVRVKTNFPLNSGDGIKIIDKTKKIQVASLGIGNIAKINNDTFEFITKYKFSAGLSVFLTQNSFVENEYLNLKRKIPINISISALSNQKIKLVCEHNNIKVEINSEYILEKAKNIPLSQDDFFSQFNKLSDTDFILNEFNVITDGIFIPKSRLNELRRNMIEEIREKIIESNEINRITFDEISYKKILEGKTISVPRNIAIINDAFDYTKLEDLNNYDIVVFSPKDFNEKTITLFYEKLRDKFALNLPTILNFNDKIIIEKVLDKLPKTISLFANNIYGLSFANEYNIIVSPLLNIKNKFAIHCLNSFNVKTICASIEANEIFTANNNLISFASGDFPLMTFAHCPYKTIHNNKCKNCSFQENLIISNPNLGQYKVKKTHIFNCYFELSKPILNKNTKFCLFNISK